MRRGASAGDFPSHPSRPHASPAPMSYPYKTLPDSFAPQSVKDVDKKDGVVTAYLSAFNNEDAHGDIIVKGAYTKSIRERGPSGTNRIKILWQHLWHEPIGIPLEMEEDEHGLLARFKIVKEGRGRDALALYEAGVLTEHSVGIDILRRSEEDRRIIEEVRLWEGSPVTWGANPLTPTLDVKALLSSRAGAGMEARIAEHISSMKRALRGPLTDETAQGLESQLRLLEAHVMDLHTALRSAPAEPAPAEGEATQGKSAPQEDPEADLLRALIDAI